MRRGTIYICFKRNMEKINPQSGRGRVENSKPFEGFWLLKYPYAIPSLNRHQDITAQRSKRTRKELIRGTVWGLSGTEFIAEVTWEPKPLHLVSSIKQVVDLNFVRWWNQTSIICYHIPIPFCWNMKKLWSSWCTFLKALDFFWGS